MFNHSDADFHIKAGDRIAQLVCEKISYPEIEVMLVFMELEYESVLMCATNEDLVKNVFLQNWQIKPAEQVSRKWWCGKISKFCCIFA